MFGDGGGWWCWLAVGGLVNSGINVVCVGVGVDCSTGGGGGDGKG